MVQCCIGKDRKRTADQLAINEILVVVVLTV
jgi:hypothetical protein